MSEFFHYFGTALAFFSSISRKKAFVRKIQFWQFSARFSWLWGIKSWWWIWRNESAMNIYPQTGFSHVDGDGALSFVIVKVPFCCDGKPSQDSRLSQQRKNSNVHSSKYDDHPNSVNGLFFTTTAVPFFTVFTGPCLQSVTPKGACNSGQQTFPFRTVSTTFQRPWCFVWITFPKNQFAAGSKEMRHEKLMCLFMFSHASHFENSLPSLAERFFEKSYLKKIFSWNELLFCVFMCHRSTMGNNGLKLIQLFQRGRHSTAQKDNLVPIHKTRATFPGSRNRPFL